MGKELTSTFFDGSKGLKKMEKEIFPTFHKVSSQNQTKISPEKYNVPSEYKNKNPQQNTN